jgi:hypothetical protein
VTCYCLHMFLLYFLCFVLGAIPWDQRLASNSCELFLTRPSCPTYTLLVSSLKQRKCGRGNGYLVARITLHSSLCEKDGITES